LGNGHKNSHGLAGVRKGEIGARRHGEMHAGIVEGVGAKFDRLWLGKPASGQAQLGYERQENPFAGGWFQLPLPSLSCHA